MIIHFSENIFLINALRPRIFPHPARRAPQLSGNLINFAPKWSHSPLLLSPGLLTMGKSKTIYHIIALLTTTIWAVTFVSSKLLLQAGLRPAEIFFLRFLLAYIAILPFAGRRLWCRSLRHELLMVVLGVTGGSAYFLSENTALQYTSAANVCLLVSAAPLLTALLSLWLGRGERLTRRLVTGALIAFVGVGLVVMHDFAHVQLRFMGDLLALLAATLWAVYQLLIKRVYSHYPATFITRKVFAYGILSVLVYFLFFPPTMTVEMLREPVVIFNLLFLGILASSVCFLSWNVAIGNLGPVKSSIYIYLQPMIAAITSAIVLGEPVTVVMVTGMVLIISGVYISERGRGKAA